MKKPEERIITIPNILSVFRILLIPIYAYLYLTAEETKDFYVAAGVMAFSMATDCIDGIIARKCNMITALGKILDPIADKLTQCVVFICLCTRWPQLYWVLAFFLIKEGFQTIMGIILLKNRKMLSGALPAGKVCTAVLFSSMILLVVFPKLSDGYVTAIAILCILALFVSFYFYFSTYMGGNHGVEIVPIRKKESEE